MKLLEKYGSNAWRTHNDDLEATVEMWRVERVSEW